MKKILFRKTTSYDLGKNLSLKNRFEYLDLLGKQQLDPEPFTQFTLPVGIFLDVCMLSVLNRVKNSLNEYTCIQKVYLDELKEIPFNLKEMVTFDEFSAKESIKVRSKFKEYFTQDRLPVKNSTIMAEIEHILVKIKNTEGESILVISHSFRLKVIEAYIKTRGKIKDNPELIQDYLFDQEKTYSFEEGFDINESDLDFLL